jgi:PPE-repeat protein
VTAVLDFALLPPEVNSARVYSGAGSGSLLVAASAWKALAADLRSTALSYGAVLSALAEEEWLGPASAFQSTATGARSATPSTLASSRVVESARNQLADAARGAANVAANC